jgi:hypothetical protein
MAVVVAGEEEDSKDLEEADLEAGEAVSLAVEVMVAEMLVAGKAVEVVEAQTLLPKDIIHPMNMQN